MQTPSCYSCHCFYAKLGLTHLQRDAPSSSREPQKSHLMFSRFREDNYAAVGGLLETQECFSPALLDTEVKVSYFILRPSLRDLNPSWIRYYRRAKAAAVDIVINAVRQNQKPISYKHLSFNELQESDVGSFRRC